MNKKFIVNVLILLFIAIFMLQCGQDNSNESSDTETGGDSAGTAQEENQKDSTKVSKEYSSKDSKYPITVTDLKGRKVTINEPVDRLVETYGPSALFTFALDSVDKLVSRSERPWDIGLALYPDYVNATPINYGGGRTNIEEVASLNPDLVILYPMGNSLEQAAKLDELNIPSVIIEPEDKERIKKSLGILGKLLEAEEKADTIIDYYDDIVKEIDNKTKDNPKPKVYYVDFDILQTISGDMMQSQMIEDANGINVTGELKGWKQEVSYEQLTVWNPDIIILSTFSRLKRDDILNNPQLQDISAIKNGKIYKSPSELDPWDFPGPNFIMGIYWMAHIFHWEDITREDLANKINNYYTDVYGKSFKELGGSLANDFTNFDVITGATPEEDLNELWREENLD
ncbi:MAG: ABC transporter substrate-binding protein [Spirochaetota bacterium]